MIDVLIVLALLVSGAGALLQLEYLARRDADRTPVQRLRGRRARS